ncbi:MAG: tetratricopeptide repeat protein, partial [bacterium]|nr:tetratricopeptide repeat protein [bacterium]
MVKRVLLFLVIGIMLSSYMTVYAGSKTKANYAALTQQAVLKGDWDKVIKYGRKWVQAEKENPVGHFVLAAAYFYKARYQEQETELRFIEDDASKEVILAWAKELVRDNPENKYARLLRGDAYVQKGDYDLIFELDPEDADAYYNRGVVYDDIGDYDLAIKDFTQAIKLDLKNAAAYNSRGLAYDDKGDDDLAIKDFTQAIELNPKYADAYLNRGVVYYYKGDYDLAIKDFTQVIELNPKYADAYLNRGVVY